MDIRRINQELVTFFAITTLLVGSFSYLIFVAFSVSDDIAKIQQNQDNAASYLKGGENK